MRSLEVEDDAPFEGGRERSRVERLRSACLAETGSGIRLLFAGKEMQESEDAPLPPDALYQLEEVSGRKPSLSLIADVIACERIVWTGLSLGRVTSSVEVDLDMASSASIDTQSNISLDLTKTLITNT